jgi:hypothetical protein
MNKKKRIQKKKIFFSAILLVLGVSLFSQDVNSQLKNQYDKKLEGKKSVYNQTLQYIYDNPQSPSLGELYFNVAEMSNEINVDKPDLTAEYYTNVLKYDPDFKKKDAVLYNIGYYNYLAKVYERNDERQNNIELVINWPDYLRLSEDKLRKSIDAFSEIKDTMLDSYYNTEAVYRLGTLYFDIALDARSPLEYYNKSIEYFDIVAAKEGDQLQYVGLFQRAWTYFNSGKFDLAINDFTTVLEVIKNDSLNTLKTFFEADAIENIAFSIIEYDGTDFEQASIAADRAKEIFANYMSEEYAKNIIFEMIELKQKYNAPMQAIDLYNTYIYLYPLSKNCPVIIDSIMTIYSKFPSRTRDDKPAEELIILEMHRLINDYKIDSEWFTANSEEDLSDEYAIISEAYQFLEPMLFNNFVQTKSEEDYFKYRYFVDDYFAFDTYLDQEDLEKSKEIRKRIIDIGLELAEEKQDPSYYFAVLEDIDGYNGIFPEHNNVLEFRENSFYCNEQIYELLKGTINEEVYSDTVFNISINAAQLDSLYIAGTYTYEDLLNNPDYISENVETELVRVIYKRAEIRYNREEYDLTIADYNTLLVSEIDSELTKLCFARLGEISLNKNNYAAAEDYYRKAGEFATEEEKETFQNNILATMQLSANTLSESSSFTDAAVEYLRLSEELRTTDEEKSIGFKFQAIEAYKKASEYQVAVDLFLEIADSKTEKDEVLAAFIGAWSITDSLPDWTQSESLRKGFIQRYPESNEAYELKLKIISLYEGIEFNDKLQAAEMYLVLHDEADHMDIGNHTKEDIYLNAIRIFQELEMEDRNIELMLAFERLYPDHTVANDFLTGIAVIFEARGDQEAFEDLARYIYKKDPTIDLLTAVAVDKMKAVKVEVDSLFTSKQYDFMYEKIDDFKALEESYKTDGLELPLSSIYEQFTYYEDFIKYHKRFDEKIQNVKDNSLNLSPDELLKVNELTKWKVNLVGGDDRILKLMQKGDGIKADLVKLIQAGNDFSMETEQRTEALFLTGKIYDYFHEVVIIQVQKFVDTSTQLNNEQMRQNPVQQKQFKENLTFAGKKMAFDFKKKASDIYQYLLMTFYDDKDYSDEFTMLSLEKLTDWGVRKPKIKEHFYSGVDWTLKEDFGSEYEITYIPNEVVLDSALVIEVSNSYTSRLNSIFTAEIKPELLTVEYLFSSPLEIKLNNVVLEKEAVVKDTVMISGVDNYVYTVKQISGLTEGENKISFKVERDSTMLAADLISVHYIVQYDQEKLELFRTTEDRELFSDDTWMSFLGELDAVVSEPDSGWVEASEAKFSFYKLQMHGLETSQAMQIWHPVLDTTAVDTAYFIKSFDIDAEVLDAGAKYIAESNATIWVNDELIIDSQDLVRDEKLNKILSHDLLLPQLLEGRNVILVKVVGKQENKGFIFDLKYTVKKSDN